MTVRHRNGAYPIVFTNLEVAATEWSARTRVVTDSNLAASYPEFLGKFEHVLEVPAGESSKSVEQYVSTLNWLADRQTRRGDTLLAFGGGVVGDLAGFAAATYMRGINLVQAPTSLLAMVDSAVGGKVGIDLPQGKNLVGAFKPPSAVVICAELLSTLPEREFRNGLAELLKYGFIMDAALVAELRDRPVTPGDSRIERLIRTALQHKAYVVERDEHETNGLRATLNFGHTVGHAIEKVLNFEDWLHGEAISAGMVVEANLSELTGKAPSGTRAQVESLLASHALPVRLPANLDPEALIAAMRLDKKAGDGGLAFSLLTQIGTCKLVTNVDPDMVRRALHDLDEA